MDGTGEVGRGGGGEILRERRVTPRASFLINSPGLTIRDLGLNWTAFRTAQPSLFTN